jgi:hypothetical protein
MGINGVYAEYREELNMKIYGVCAEYVEDFYMVLNRIV